MGSSRGQKEPQAEGRNWISLFWRMVPWATLPPKPEAWQPSTIRPHSPLIGHKTLLLLPEDSSSWHLFKPSSFCFCRLDFSDGVLTSLPVSHLRPLQLSPNCCHRELSTEQIWVWSSPVKLLPGPHCLHDSIPTSQDAVAKDVIWSGLMASALRVTTQPVGRVSALQAACHCLWWLCWPLCLIQVSSHPENLPYNSSLHPDLDGDSFYGLQQHLMLTCVKAFIKPSDRFFAFPIRLWPLWGQRMSFLPKAPHRSKNRRALNESLQKEWMKSLGFYFIVCRKTFRNRLCFCTFLNLFNFVSFYKSF